MPVRQRCIPRNAERDKGYGRAIVSAKVLRLWSFLAGDEL